MARRSCKQATVAVAVGALGLAGHACAQEVPPVPPAEPTGVAGMCVVVGFEYAGRWSQPDNGFNSPDQDDCAMQCSEDPTCSGATWILDQPFKEVPNCWFKQWPEGPAATPCYPGPPSATRTFNALIKAPDCAAITYMDEPLSCEVEMAQFPDGSGAGAAAPAPEDDAAAGPISEAMPNEMELMGLEVPYKAFPDVDYSVDDFVDGGTTVSPDLAKSEEMSAADCAQTCIDTPDCNAAAWYGADPTWTVAQNCFLKMFGSECMPPPEAKAVPGAFLLLPQGPNCPAGEPMAAPLPAPAAGAVPVLPAPADPLAQPPAPARDFGFAAPPTTAPAPTASPPAPAGPGFSTSAPGAEAGATSTDAAASVHATALLAVALSAAALFLA